MDLSENTYERFGILKSHCDFIEKARKIYRDTPLMPFYHYLSNVSYGLVLTSTLAESKIGFREQWIEYLKEYQIDTLADNSVHHYRYAQLPHLRGPFFRNQGSSYNFESVDSTFELLMDEMQKLILSSLKFFYRHKWWVLCRKTFSSTFILPDRQDFVLHSVTWFHRP